MRNERTAGKLLGVALPPCRRVFPDGNGVVPWSCTWSTGSTFLAIISLPCIYNFPSPPLRFLLRHDPFQLQLERVASFVALVLHGRRQRSLASPGRRPRRKRRRPTAEGHVREISAHVVTAVHVILTVESVTPRVEAEPRPAAQRRCTAGT